MPTENLNSIVKNRKGRVLHPAKNNEIYHKQLTEFIEDNYKRLLRYAARVSKSGDTSEELLQETIEKIYEGEYAPIDFMKSPLTQFYYYLQNTNYRVRINRQGAFEEGRVYTGTKLECSVIRDEFDIAERVTKSTDTVDKTHHIHDLVYLMTCLNPKQKACIEAVLDGCSYSEIAATQQCSQQNIAQIVMAAKKKMKAFAKKVHLPAAS